MPTAESFTAWVNSFPYEDAKKELEDLRAQVSDLNTRFYQLQELIQLYDRIRSALPASSAPPATNLLEDIQPVQVGKFTVREAIRTLMAEHPERNWTSDQIWGLLTQRGWLRNDPQGKANMFAMLSTMTSQGQIERVERGVYRLLVSAPEVPS